MEDFEESDMSFGEMMDLIRQYEDAEKTNRQLFLDEESYERIVEFYQDNREFKRALSVIENALTHYSYSSVFFIKKAEVLTEQNKLTEALEALEEAEKFTQNDIAVFLIRADIFLSQGKHEMALDVLKYAQSIAEDSDDICDLFLEKADVYEDMGLYLEVIDALQEVLKHNPENEEALNRIWFCVELTGKYEESMLFHKTMVDKFPYNHLAWFNLGHAYTGLEKYDEALEAFGFVTAIEEEFEPAYIFTGDVYFYKNEFNAALDAYHEALKIAKSNKDIFYKVAECYEQLKDFHKARVYLRKAIAIDPYFDEAFFKIGETYREEENLPKAITAFERALKISPENIDFLSTLGDALIMNAEVDRAVPVLEKVLELDPKTKSHYIHLATAYYGIEDFRACFDTLTLASDKFEDAADIYFIKFVFYYQIGNKNEGIVNLEKGLLINFDEHSIIFDLDPLLIEDDTIMAVIEQYKN